MFKRILYNGAFVVVLKREVIVKSGWKVIIKAAGLLTSVYGVTLATVWANQEKLLFKPDPFSRIGQSLRAMRGARSQGRRVREWIYKAPDGVNIQGFLSLPEADELPSQKLPCVVYLGGIREESSWSLEHANEFDKKIFICMNYRGYGLSEGNPEQEKILQDTESALRMLIDQGQIDERQIYLVGRSLGSGIAGYLCTKIKTKMVCLVTPYDSVLSVAKRKYWFLPVGLIFRHPFDAMPWAKKNDSKMLMLLSEVDATVPHEHSQNLFKAWKGEKTQITLNNCDHSSIVRHPDFFKTLANFFFKN